MTKRITLLTALSALGLLAAACGAGATAPEITATPVVVAPAAVGDVEQRIEGTGELVAPDRALIAAEVDGRITEIRVDEGASVRSAFSTGRQPTRARPRSSAVVGGGDAGVPMPRIVAA